MNSTFVAFILQRFKTSTRRIVVALLYWVEEANAQHNKDWYDAQIQDAINGFSRQRSFKSSSPLPHRQSWPLRTKACMTTSYKQAALNALVVGNIVGELDKHIRNGLAKDEIYTTFCIGLSLGAHVCGFIGKSSKMVINRKKSPIILTTKRRLILTQGIHVSTLIVIYI